MEKKRWRWRHHARTTQSGIEQAARGQGHEAAQRDQPESATPFPQNQERDQTTDPDRHRRLVHRSEGEGSKIRDPGDAVPGQAVGQHHRDAQHEHRRTAAACLPHRSGGRPEHKGGAQAQAERAAEAGGEHVLGRQVEARGLSRQSHQLSQHEQADAGEEEAIQAPIRVGPDKHLKGQGQQPVARQDGQRLAELLVTGRQSAAQVVVVHRRQIVVDE